MAIRWLTAFLDGPSDPDDERFWTAVTATALSSRRREHAEFVTLLPATGDAYLRRQTTDGPAGVHLDLHSDSPAQLVAYALELQAAPVAALDGVTVLRSPGGFTFCVVGWDSERVRPDPVAGVVLDGCTVHSRLDQLCLDIPRGRFGVETSFWAQLTGWEQRAGALPDFDYLVRPAAMPLRLLLQRTDGDGPVGGHLDVAAGEDAAGVVAWHVQLGATREYEGAVWTTMRDPAGRSYCVTRRAP